MGKSSKISSKFGVAPLEICWDFSCSLSDSLEGSKAGTFETIWNIGPKLEHFEAEKSCKVG